MAQDSTIILIGVIFLIAILVAPSIFGRPTIIENLLNLGRDILNDLLNRLFGNFGDGDTGMGLTIEYADGTTEQLDPENMNSYAVYYEDKPISRIFGIGTYRLNTNKTIMTTTVYHNHSKYFDLINIAKETGTKDTTLAKANEWTVISNPTSAHVFNVDEIIKLDDEQYTTHELRFFVNIVVDYTLHGEQMQRTSGSASATITVDVRQDSATLETKVVPVEFSVYNEPLT